MYHKESGTGNDPFLVGNMLCRRWSLSPLRISALINLPQLFLPAKETYHLDARSLARFQSILCTLRLLPSRDIVWDVTGKVDMPLWISAVAKTRQENRKDHCYCSIQVASKSIEFWWIVTKGSSKKAICCLSPAKNSQTCCDDVFLEHSFENV